MSTSTIWYEPLAGHPLLVRDFKGVVRLASSPRVRIALIVEACKLEGSPEAMCHEYQYLTVEEARYVMTYYAAHREEIDAELARDQAEWERLDRDLTANPPPVELKLRAMRRERGLS